MFYNDITFCLDPMCNARDICLRYISNADMDIPVSYFSYSPRKEDGCEMFIRKEVLDKLWEVCNNGASFKKEIKMKKTSKKTSTKKTSKKK